CCYVTAPATTHIYPPSLHDALPILPPRLQHGLQRTRVDIRAQPIFEQVDDAAAGDCCINSEVGCSSGTNDERTARVHFHDLTVADRKSTRLNSSHVKISYAVFCLKK